MMSIETFWLPLGNDKIFCRWYLVPESIYAPVLIVPPVGPEYMHCHTSLRRLSLELQRAGIPSLYFDWPGYGNSSGDSLSSEIVQSWIDTTKYLCAWLNEATGHLPALISLRSAALLSQNCLAENLVSANIWWYPYTQGRSLVRDLQLIDAHLGCEDSSGKTLVGGGYTMLNSAAEDLQKLKLNVSKPGKVQRSLVLRGPEQRTIAAVKQLTEFGLAVEVMEASGLKSMARQAELSITPKEDITAIVDWCLKNEATPHHLSHQTGSLLQSEEYQESVLELDHNSGLFAIHTEPLEIRQKKICLLMPNTGSGHHVGPNRLHVELARSAAQKGYGMVRMDISNLGDSDTMGDVLNSDAYTTTAAEEILSAAYKLRQEGYERILVLGLCAGAYSSFQSLLHDDTELLDDVILINPRALYWSVGQNASVPESEQRDVERKEYANNWKSLSSWYGLVINPEKWLRVGFTVCRMLVQKTLHMLPEALKPADRLAKDLKAITLNRNVHFVFSPHESGMIDIQTRGGKVLQALRETGSVNWHELQDGDHTFTTRYARQKLIDTVLKII